MVAVLAPCLPQRLVVDGVALRLRLPAPAGTGRLANRALTLASQRKASHQSQHSHHANSYSAFQPPACRTEAQQRRVKPSQNLSLPIRLP